MPTLAKQYTLVVPDQRGIGLSDKPATGYDAGTLANDMAQNAIRMKVPLAIPVLAIGGEFSTRDSIGALMRLVATDVQPHILPGSGHCLAEESPTELLAALTPFLAPHRAGG